MKTPQKRNRNSDSGKLRHQGKVFDLSAAACKVLVKNRMIFKTPDGYRLAIGVGLNQVVQVLTDTFSR